MKIFRRKTCFLEREGGGDLTSFFCLQIVFLTYLCVSRESVLFSQEVTEKV